MLTKQEIVDEIMSMINTSPMLDCKVRNPSNRTKYLLS